MIEEATDRFDKRVKSGTASFGWWEETGFKYKDNQACHSRIRDLPKGVEYFYTSIDQRTNHTNPLTEEERFTYYKMLFVELLYSQMFTVEEFELAMERGFLITSTDKPVNLFVSFLIASRLPWEYPQTVKHIVEMRNRGVKPELCMYIGHLMNVRNGVCTFDNYTGVHHTIYKGWEKRAVIRYINGEYDDSHIIREDGAGYSNIVASFGVECYQKPYSTTLYSILKKKEVGRGQYDHPFPAYSTLLAAGDKALPYPEIYEWVVEKEQEILEDLANG